MGRTSMKIKIINPNTTWSMTREIEESAKQSAREDTEIYAVSPATGPDSVELSLIHISHGTDRTQKPETP